MTAPRPVDVVQCAGCLGAQECWVCLGSGANDTQNGLGACRSCGGSRRCRYCEDVAAPRRRATDLPGA